MSGERLETLITRWSTGVLSLEEGRELEALLRAEPEARLRFRRHASLDTGLREWAEERAGANPWQPVAVHERAPRFARWPVLATAAAAVLLAGGWLWQAKRSPAPSAATVVAERTAQGCAVLTQTLGATFAQGPRMSGDTLLPGQIKLSAGFAQIEFFSGATALVEGAAQIEIVSAWEARVVSGRVRVHVPPAAKGFTLHAPGWKLEDLGTEFGLNVDPAQQTSAVHVFEGEVIAHATGGGPQSLTQGMSLSRDASGTTQGGATADRFLPIGELQGLVKQHEAQRFSGWKVWSQEARQDPRLIAYYLFKHWPDDRWDRLVNNFAEPKRKERAGGAVGARWTQGRWPGKEALEFKRPGDRVRINLDGSYSALTLACWVKVDSVDKKYNSLLLTDGYENGEPHWQIYEDGSLMFSVMYLPDGATRGARWNQMYFSKPVFTADSLGRWHHLAVTYDNHRGEVIQYFDSQEVGREVSKLHQPGRPIVFGPCEIGNWGLPTAGHQFPIRNLNGAIDEFAIYGSALTSAELRTIFQEGRPE